jgi:VIT1/CCC1 family predicted Fe2+/Mn2+ transporter
MVAFSVSLGASLAALALLGIGIATLTRRPAWYGAIRQVMLGGVAAAVTYAVGFVVGIGVS